MDVKIHVWLHVVRLARYIFRSRNLKLGLKDAVRKLNKQQGFSKAEHP